MEQINVKAKKWGNSIGIILPKFIVEKESIDEGTDLVIRVDARHKSTVKDLMNISRKIGLDKKLRNVNTQEALKKVDEAFWSE